MPTAPASAQPTVNDDTSVEWVRTGSDSVIALDAWESLPDELPSVANSSDLPFGGVNLGDGFNVFGLRSYGDYTIRLVAGGDIESYRERAQLFANVINVYNTPSITVAPGVIPAPLNPVNMSPPTGEIWIMISLASPCGNLSGGVLGCGGVTGSTVVNGESRWSAGAVWLSPTLSTACTASVVGHEIGHAIGLDHYEPYYYGVPQLMRSTTYCIGFETYQSGDLNGLRWLSEPLPLNDSVADASLVCPGDSSMSANTWFALREYYGSTPLEPAHAGIEPRRSVWYKYVPRAEQHGGTAFISTANDGVDDFDTVLAVYTGHMFDPFRPVSWPYFEVIPVVSDNGATPGNLSAVSFTIDAAKTYWIAVDGVGLARGEMDVVFDLPDLDSSLVPLCAPARVLDTRPSGQTVDGQHRAVGAIAAGTTYELPIAGRADVPADAASVVLNVTAVARSAGGYVTVFPCGAEQPNSSNLNFAAGDSIPNSVIAGIGTAGSVCLFSSVSTQLLVDVSGYFPDTTALQTLPAPARLLDTRDGGETIDDAHEGVGRLGAGVAYELQVTDRADVPVGSASVVLNVTAVQPSGGGYLTVYPCGDSPPNASNLNFVAGDIIANLVLAKVGTDGKVCFFASADTHLLVDVSGYFANTTYLKPLAAPARVLDTRFPSGTTVDGQYQAVGSIAAGTTYQVQIAGRANVPANAFALMLNVTAVAPSGAGYISVFPCGQDLPNASNLNFVAGEVIPNSVLSGVGTDGRVCIYSSATINVLVDVSGYFL